ncbi:phage portal protein [Corynebacterium accolens]|uniref:phage portal protein n=1 Tax=Corynebacterium accolens TaxID=38284 RepID=UPI00254B8205|nr:phage portal protein [Corynebacterium accolens]MDK8469833.1 phage portal protein [Corynebacterium accolens]
MTMPAANTPWPPEKWAPVTSMVGDAALWWEGDTKSLDSHYGGAATFRPSQFAGGVVGAVSRFFWGQPTPQGQSNRKMHLPIAADIAATSASLLFDTPPTFTVDNEQAQVYLDEMLNDDRFPADLLVMAESCAALGGVYGRVMWDTEVSDNPWIDFVDADSAYPEFSYGKLTAITFHEELPKLDEKHVWRLLSRYTKGRIEYSLYEGRANNLGDPRPLANHPATEALSNVVDSQSGVDSHTAGIAAVYIPNARPVVGFRGDGQLRNIGRPDISPDLFPLFDMLDETWTDMRREMRLGKQRAVVPEYWLDSQGFGKGQQFDHDREFYDAVASTPTEGQGVQFYSPELRFEYYLNLADKIVLEILRRANYSPATFGLAGTNSSGQKTAREIESEYQSSIQTWKSKSRYMRAGLSELSNSLLEVHAWLHNLTPPTERVKVDMTAPVQETMLDKASTIQALDAARAISTQQKIDMLHHEWDEQDKQAEVERIIAEQAGTFDPLGSVEADEYPLGED